MRSEGQHKKKKKKKTLNASCSEYLMQEVKDNLIKLLKSDTNESRERFKFML